MKDMVSEHFLFWQVYNTSRDGERYIQFYPVTQYPYIAIIDPRTGELVENFNNVQSPDLFLEQIIEFLRDRPSPDGTTNHQPISTHLVNGSTSTAVVDIEPSASIYDADEEAQLAAAIKASLEPSAQIKPIPISIESDSSDGSNDSFVSGDSATPKVDDSPEVIISEVVDDYTQYLGSEASDKTELVLRYPDGNKEKMTFPVDSKLKVDIIYFIMFGSLISRIFRLSSYTWNRKDMDWTSMIWSQTSLGGTSMICPQTTRWPNPKCCANSFTFITRTRNTQSSRCVMFLIFSLPNLFKNVSECVLWK